MIQILVVTFFHKDTSLGNSIFKKMAEFGYTKFFKNGNFQNVTFEGSTCFNHSQFIEKGDFDGTCFSEIIFNATESKRLIFTNTTFRKLEFRRSLVASCQFGESVFLNKIEISHNFFGSVNFYRCQFHDFCILQVLILVRQIFHIHYLKLELIL